MQHYYTPSCTSINYFEAAKAIASSTVPGAVLPHRIFASSTTAFFLAVKPMLRMLIDDTAEAYSLPNLWLAITDYYCHAHSADTQVEITAENMQIWSKIQVQQPTYHDRQLVKLPQSLIASPPSM